MPAPLGPSPALLEGDSDDSYDSEEERFVARQAAARHASAAAAQRRAQAELLAAYRAQQQAREALERDALAAKLHAQWGLGSSGAWDAHSEAGWQQREAWCGGSGAAHQARAWLRALQQHEGRWAALEAAVSSDAGGDSCSGDSCSSGKGSAAPACITYAQIPWPPLDCEDYLLAMAAGEQQLQQQQQQLNVAGQQRQQQQQQQQQQNAPAQQQGNSSVPAPQAAQRAQRRAYARACLRWHPDKFVARWGALLDPADRDRILERVQALSQGLNEAWEALQQRAAGDGQG